MPKNKQSYFRKIEMYDQKIGFFLLWNICVNMKNRYINKIKLILGAEHLVSGL